MPFLLMGWWCSVDCGLRGPTERSCCRRTAGAGRQAAQPIAPPPPCRSWAAALDRTMLTPGGSAGPPQADPQHPSPLHPFHHPASSHHPASFPPPRAVWGLVSGGEPYPGCNAMQIIVQVAQQGQRPDVPPDCPPFLASLLQRCWSQDPLQRCGWVELVAFTSRLACLMPCWVAVLLGQPLEGSAQCIGAVCKCGSALCKQQGLHCFLLAAACS